MNGWLDPVSTKPGEDSIPVTGDEVYQWVFAVARIPRDSWRAWYYIEYWRVPEKIRVAKATGTFYEIIAGSEPLGGANARL